MLVVGVYHSVNETGLIFSALQKMDIKDKRIGVEFYPKKDEKVEIEYDSSASNFWNMICNEIERRGGILYSIDDNTLVLRRTRIAVRKLGILVKESEKPNYENRLAKYEKWIEEFDRQRSEKMLLTAARNKCSIIIMGVTHALDIAEKYGHNSRIEIIPAIRGGKEAFEKLLAERRASRPKTRINTSHQPPRTRRNKSIRRKRR